jgi:TonB family protein
MPIFPGNEEGFIFYLRKNLVYPKEAVIDEIEGKVLVTFCISKEGVIENYSILKGVCPEINEEALRVVSSMPQWFPAMSQGKFAEVQYTLPINFRLH